MIWYDPVKIHVFSIFFVVKIIDIRSNKYLCVILQKVNSCELYTVLIVILVLDVACLTTWQIKDPLYRTVETFDMETQTNTDEDIVYQPQLEHCTSKNMSVWLGK